MAAFPFFTTSNETLASEAIFPSEKSDSLSKFSTKSLLTFFYPASATFCAQPPYKTTEGAKTTIGVIYPLIVIIFAYAN